MDKHRMVYWALIEHQGWNLALAATQAGLVYVGAGEYPMDVMTQWVGSYSKRIMVEEDNKAMAPYVAQLVEYLNGERQQFTVPLHLLGSPFQVAVWRALAGIPYGTTCSYSDIAEQVGKPKAVRAVGGAVGANPLSIIIPCHRVIGKNGAPTGYAWGLDMKRRLLELERSGCGQAELSSIPEVG